MKTLMRTTISAFTLVFGLSLLGINGASAQSLDDITLNVYKEETCGCCVGWIAHMDERGFASKVIHPKDLYAVKEELGVLRQWQSCHTAVSTLASS